MCCLIIQDDVYVMNVGDSRALLSADNGEKVYRLTTDHKPTNIDEKRRIVTNGGKVYRTQSLSSENSEEHVFGPYRVSPGRLSVSRAFGDIEAKRVKFKGTPNVVIATPEIKKFKVRDKYDFLIMASDGVFDKMGNTEIVDLIYA